MQAANLVLLHVADPAASAEFYHHLLGHAPVEQSPTFAMFVLPGGFKIGLWSANAVEPASSTSTGASEIAFTCASDAEVDGTFEEWKARGATILQAPVQLDFGRTFTAADPDQHRLRVYCPPVERRPNQR